MCLAVGVVSAQDIIIFGQVVSAADGEPLQAANVWFKNTQIGTATNNEGYFILRSNEPYKTLCVSVIGFRRKEVKLTGSDQVLTIALKEERNMLNELIVLPSDNEALPLLRRVRERASENNPDKIGNFSTVEQQNLRLSLTNIRRKTMQRKLLRGLATGTIAAADSTLFMPLYDAVQVDAVTTDSIDGVVRHNLSHDETTLQLLPPNQVGVFLQNYAPNVNFYRSHITALQTNFISPLSAQGTLYYQYFLIDSVLCDSDKTYYIRFRPKNDKELAFKGEMWIDSASLALRRIKASLSPAAAINYLNGLTIEQTFAKTDNGKFYYDRRDYAMSFSLNLFDKNAKNGTSVVYAQRIENRQTASSVAGDSVPTAQPDSVALFVDSTAQERHRFRAAIDSLNQSTLQRIAYGLVDFVLNGYVHAWKFDVGPGINWFRYNKLEGFRPTLALRTGEKLTEYFTVGGYVGYGFGDKQWKYGGELQAAPSVRNRTILEYLDTPLVWINVEGEAETDENVQEDREGDSILNREEAEYTIAALHLYIEKLTPRRVRAERIDFAIISPYKAQVRLLRQLLKRDDFLKPFRRQVSINTVDAFQGQERDVVIISMVRANEQGHIGFLGDLRRMNVAITRARYKVIIVGHAETLCRHRFYRELRSRCHCIG